MKKNIFFKAILDGVIESAVITIFPFCLVLAPSTISADTLLVSFVVLGTILSTPTYYLFLRKERNNAKIVRFSVISTVSFILFTAIAFVLRITFPLSFSSTQITDDAPGTGLLIIFAVGAFMVVSTVLKACIFITLIIKNIYRNRQKKR